MGLKMRLFTPVQQLIRKAGYEIIRHNPIPGYDAQIDATINAVTPFTMTSHERIAAVCEAVRYISARRIPGDIVECGVWRGGSMMAAARTLLEMKDTDRHLYLYDTFEGMTRPGEEDVSHAGVPAARFYEEFSKTREGWCLSGLEEVKQNMASVGYDMEKMHFIQGKVEHTIPDGAPGIIALLRLDTDWYDSTRHEMLHLFPRISRGGVLIIDDYGDWQGARKAVDEYILQNDLKLLLNRIDHTGRIAVSIGPE